MNELETGFYCLDCGFFERDEIAPGGCMSCGCAPDAHVAARIVTDVNL